MSLNIHETQYGLSPHNKILQNVEVTIQYNTKFIYIRGLVKNN